ncbi:nucleotidyltransferase family protein [Halocynthiibacter namhaensis]|uniref:nucleotidyltransferase family protein n=1 Tax=Halocynthiibacter namhaensis TaxID=1290553 RepID=UPI00068F5D2D|nr:nucleotidyltransferase family protein [Halocynthiibacter namhaensis]
MTRGIYVLMLAAGASRRMRGEDKLLREIQGVSLLERSVCRAVQSGADGVHVVLPSRDGPRADCLADMNVSITVCEECAEGMGASLRAGVSGLPDDAAAVIVTLADMPDIGAEHYRRLMERFNATARGEKNYQILRAVTDAGQVGHPVLFGSGWFERLCQAKGDQGARDILKQEQRCIEYVTTFGEGAVVDLDTPEAWEGWMAKPNGSS